jgi:pimeloyl-ACP methyl ester carboxylesterase
MNGPTLDPIPAEWSHAMTDLIPNADVALIEDGGHFPMIENPDHLRSAVPSSCA